MLSAEAAGYRLSGGVMLHLGGGASCLLQRAAFNLLMATCCFRRAVFYIIRAARRLRRAATLSEVGIMLSEGGEEGILPQRAAGYSRGRHDEFRGRYYAF